MLKPHIYIVQVLVIAVLLCGYFLSDQPDSLSVMHFDPASPSVFSKAVKSTDNMVSLQTCTSSQSDPRHKSTNAKYISYEVILPHKSVYIFPVFVTPVIYTFPLHEKYDYLFYKEINPPPPKVVC